jgi:hypothetical protein
MRFAGLFTGLVLFFAGAAAVDVVGDTKQISRFEPVYVYIDSGQEQLAAYQFELRAVKGNVKIVGVEGGEHKAFSEPPYYDPAALMNNRIIIAAFNTGEDLPTGWTRAATIHFQIIGDVEPEYEIKLAVAADGSGRRIPAKTSIEKGTLK